MHPTEEDRMDESRTTEVTLPATALAALRRALRREAGPSAAVEVMQRAGYESGRALHARLLEALPEPPNDLAPDVFWSRFRGFWLRRGWGRLEHRDTHPAVGLLVSKDWPEADTSDGGGQPVCAFTSGMFAGLLGAVADGPLAVLEIRCRARGDTECAFAFGADRTVHAIYGDLLEGRSFDEALSAL